MTVQKQVYKCNICGNIVEVLHSGVGELICCGQPMELLREITKDEGLEKHVPAIEKTDKGIIVKVGSIPHPMEEKHYIEWIEIIVNGRVYRRFLNPGDKPEAEFETRLPAPRAQLNGGQVEANKIEAREYCNLHGLWKA